MNSVNAQVQDMLLRLQEPAEALALMGYHSRMQRIIDDHSCSVQEKVYRIISSELFRSISFPEANQVFVRAKIQHAYEHKENLTFVVPFGAYKTHYSYSYPFPNFAEVFNILYMKLFAHVLKGVYPFGVSIVYVPDLRDHVREITAIPLAALEQYHRAYEELFYHFVKSGDSLSLMNNEALYARLRVSSGASKDAVRARMTTPSEPVSEEVLVTLLGSAHIAGIESASTGALLARVKEMYNYHRHYVGFIDDELLRVFPDAILITPKKHLPPYLTSIKCFYNSVVQFWVGDGVLIHQRQKAFPTIASKSQVKSFHFVEYADIHDSKLPTSNNYLRYMPVYEKTND